MMNKLFTFFCFIILQLSLNGQHTFSIVAIDSITGQVGSAGATCLTSADCGGCGGAVIISGLVRGKGAINAQAQVCIPNSNLNNGMTYISEDNDAEATLALLLSNDACGFGSTADRQYGIATLDANKAVTTKSYTGANALDHAGARVGKDYSIQGNILLGPEILDSMEARYLRADGQSLANRLMESLQGANVPGADSRCLVDGISSKSSFLRVSKPDDPDNDHFIDLVIPFNSGGVDPIDDLQDLYDVYLLTSGIEPITNNPPLVTIKLESGQLEISLDPALDDCFLHLYSLNAQCLFEGKLNSEIQFIDASNFKGQFIIANVIAQDKIIYSSKIFIK